MADFNKPSVLSRKIEFPDEIRASNTSLAKMFDGTTDQNIPLNSKKINHVTGECFNWDGSAWVSLGFLCLNRDPINDLVDGAPAALDTLNELAAALADDQNFASSVTNSLNQKMDKTADGADINNKQNFRNNINVYPKSEVYTKTEIDALIISEKYVELTSSGTFDLTNINCIEVIAIGGGGGGGGGSTGGGGPNDDFGGEGGSSGFSVATVIDTTGINSMAFTIGAQGLGGSVSSDGTDGGDTTFGALVACGGPGGRQGSHTHQGAIIIKKAQGIYTPGASSGNIGGSGGEDAYSSHLFSGETGLGGIPGSSEGSGGGGGGPASLSKVIKTTSLGNGGTGGQHGSDGSDATGHGAGGGGGGGRNAGGDGSPGIIFVRVLETGA